MEGCEFELCNFLFLFSAFLLWIVSSLLRVLPLLEQKSLHVEINGCVESIFQVRFASYFLLLPTIAPLHKQLSYGSPDNNSMIPDLFAPSLQDDSQFACLVDGLVLQ